ncbi:sulfotransferase family protein [Christiangramia echinicola]|uniref:sulfotransferase family protein n=1 Tax=Christiangramia echinicola TaxID=279359 RepID=UPI00042A1EF8|nr:sulfotransferase [Christiangramia echinicola]
MTDAHPLFILGNPRSGTSLFRIMLTSHPNICIPPECGFIQWWYSKYKNWSKTDSTNEIRVTSYIEDLKSSKKIETWNLDFSDLHKLIVKSMASNYAELSFCVLQQFCSQQNKNAIYLGDKNNYYIHHLDIIREIYPTAKYLAIVRDGRDVACSYKNLKNLKSTSKYKPILPTEIGEIAEEWRENNLKLLNFGEMIGTKNFTFIRFEDLLTNSEGTLQSICSFLQIDYNIEMLKYAENNINNKIEPDKLVDWKKKTFLPPDSSSIGKYKYELTRNEIETFQSVNSDLIDLLGYDKI